MLCVRLTIVLCWCEGVFCLDYHVQAMLQAMASGIDLAKSMASPASK
jgi:hypothetical protein